MQLRMTTKSCFPCAVLTAVLTFCLSGVLVADTVPPKNADSGVQHVDAQKAQKLVLEKKVAVLDVRTPGEFNRGHIGGATNIDFQGPDFEQKIEGLDRSKNYLVHCASGGRSTRSLLLFKKHQFLSIYHLDGGLKAWEKAGLPVEK